MYEYVLELGRLATSGKHSLTSTCVCECALDELSTLGRPFVATILLLLFLYWRQLSLFFFFLFLLLVLLRLHGPDQAPPPPPLVEEGHVPEGVTLAEIPIIKERLVRKIRFCCFGSITSLPPPCLAAPALLSQGGRGRGPLLAGSQNQGSVLQKKLQNDRES